MPDLLRLSASAGTLRRVILGYLDESFSNDWYYMAALLCDGPGVQALGTELDAVVADAVDEYDLPTDTELHGYELFQGEGWWKDASVRVRLSVYNKAFEAIARHCQALILRGMHSAGQRKRYISPDPPHSVVLMHLLERVNTYAQDHDEHVLVIADEVGEQARHRSDLAFYRANGTWGYRSTKLTQIVDTLHFAPSDASRLVQAIDLVVFMYRRMETHTEPNEKAARANRRLWARIAPKVHHQWCWHP